MAGDETGVGKRGRMAEDEYFARRDRELIEAQQQKAIEAQHVRKLGEALGLADEGLLSALRAEGVDASQAPLVHVLPALEVAWSDGSVGKAEGELVREQLRRQSNQQPSAEIMAAFDNWLLYRPSDKLFAHARHAARLGLSKAGGAERAAGAKRILDDAKAVAEAGGGLLGLGTVSTPERRALEALAAELGVEAG